MMIWQDVMATSLIFYVPDTHMQSDTCKSICQSIQTKLLCQRVLIIYVPYQMSKGGRNHQNVMSASLISYVPYQMSKGGRKYQDVMSASFDHLWFHIK